MRLSRAAKVDHQSQQHRLRLRSGRCLGLRQAAGFAAEITLARRPNSIQHGLRHSLAIRCECGATRAESGKDMSLRCLLAAAICSIVAMAVSPSFGQSLRYANQGELKSLDPYTLKETT